MWLVIFRVLDQPAVEMDITKGTLLVHVTCMGGRLKQECLQARQHMPWKI